MSEEQACFLSVEDLCRFAREAGYEEEDWGRYGYIEVNGSLVVGPIDSDRECVVQLSFILEQVAQDERTCDLPFGDIFVWIDEEGLRDPDGMTMVLMSREEIAEMQVKCLN